MKLVWSDKFKCKIGDYFDYWLDKILNGLSRFPESGRIELLLQGMDKEYRAINLDKLFKIIYSIGDDTITIETLWNMKRNPKSLKKDI